MSDHDGKTTAAANQAPCPPELRPRLERMRALRSAWGVIAPVGLMSGGEPVATIGGLLNDHLNDLARRGASPDALASVDSGLEEFARMLRAVAFQVPIVQLRSELPAQLGTNRRGVLDLLDLLIDSEIVIDETPAPIGPVDYVITLLSLGISDDGSTLRDDPVRLTPRLLARCQRAEAEADQSAAEIASDFAAAAVMDAEGRRDELEKRNLRRRKAELGESYFVPEVLRAVVAYNATLVQHVSDEVSTSQDWGKLPSAESVAASAGSIFETSALRTLAEALRRRAAGAAPSTSPVDRIAWCLDLDYPDVAETRALLAESVGSPEDLKGTAILVGLLCRSVVVLADELSDIGIPPDQLSTGWVEELDERFKAENDRLVAGDAYTEACALSELRHKYLYAPQTPVLRAAPRPKPAAPKPDDVRKEARELAGDAVAQARHASTAARSDRRPVPWTRLLGIAAALSLVALGVNLVRSDLDEDLTRYRGADLTRISPYLSEGGRGGAGRGPTFVGTLRDSWAELSEAEREAAAEAIVESLRAKGVRDIMVYDDDGALRLQALGTQPVLVLSGGR